MAKAKTKQRIERIVLTGGPSSGKSAVIEELAKRGYGVCEEVAREVLDERGEPSSFEEMDALQVAIYREQSRREVTVQSKTFLDRSIIDGFAYAKQFLGYVPEQMCLPTYRYDRVFLFDRLPLIFDGTRTEKSEAEAQTKHDIVVAEYKAQGYDMIPVPVFPHEDKDVSIKRRADFVLQQLDHG